METLSGFWHKSPVVKFLNWLPFDGANAVFNGQLAICVWGNDEDFVWTGVCADALEFRDIRVAEARLPDLLDGVDWDTEEPALVRTDCRPVLPMDIAAARLAEFLPETEDFAFDTE